MGWNPSREVAVARDAAEALDSASMCVVVWVSNDGTKLGMASYGKTKKLCDVAKSLGDSCYESALEFFEE